MSETTTNTKYERPLPFPSLISRPFWDAARRHELMLQQCQGCQRFVHYPRASCPYCWSNKLEWRKCSGRGKLYSFTYVRQPLGRAYGSEPYILAIVELEEGPRMTTNLVALPETLRCNMPVNVFFDDVTPEHTLVRFKPAA